MLTSFQQNPPFDAKFEAEFIISDGQFTTNGQQETIQHFYPLLNLTGFTSYKVDQSAADSTSLLIEWRNSTDTVVWSAWSPISTIVQSSPHPVVAKQWLQFRASYTAPVLNTPISNLFSISLQGTRYIDPIFQSAILEPGIPLVFTVADTYKVFKMESFQIFTGDGALIPSTVAISFRYSQTHGRTWSQWLPLSEAVLKSTKFDPIRFCDFQFGFINNGTDPVSIFDLELIGDFQNITGNYTKSNRLGLKSQCNPITQPVGPCDPNCTDGYIDQFGNIAGTCCIQCGPCSTGTSPWSWNSPCGDGCTIDNLFRVNERKSYGLLPELKEHLDQALSARNGWKVEYALADPDQQGSDQILHEHQLFNVIAIRQVDIVVPKNQFPTRDLSFSGMDLDLIQSFEVHIPKSTFKNVFGVEFRPGKFDYLYLCDFNQLWEVDQIVPTRTAFATETYWRVMLKKYNQRDNRKHINTTDKSWHDALVKNTTLDDLFINQTVDQIAEGVKDQVNITQPSQSATQHTVINFRQSLDPNVLFAKEVVVNSTLTLSETQFSMPLMGKGKKLVKYKYSDKELTAGDNRAISLWFKAEDYDPTWQWTLFHNMQAGNGYKLLLEGGGLTLTVNSQQWTLPITLIKDVWYSIYVGLDQRSGQEVEIAVYKRQSETGNSIDTKLIQVARQVWPLAVSESFLITSNPYIGGVDLMNGNTSGNSKRWYLTGFRVWKTIIEKNERNKVLNDKVVRDTQLIIIQDDGQEFFNLPSYGNF